MHGGSGDASHCFSTTCGESPLNSGRQLSHPVQANFPELTPVAQGRWQPLWALAERAPLFLLRSSSGTDRKTSPRGRKNNRVEGGPFSALARCGLRLPLAATPSTIRIYRYQPSRPLRRKSLQTECLNTITHWGGGESTPASNCAPGCQRPSQPAVRPGTAVRTDPPAVRGSQSALVSTHYGAAPRLGSNLGLEYLSTSAYHDSGQPCAAAAAAASGTGAAVGAREVPKPVRFATIIDNSIQQRLKRGGGSFLSAARRGWFHERDSLSTQG